MPHVGNFAFPYMLRCSPPWLARLKSRDLHLLYSKKLLYFEVQRKDNYEIFTGLNKRECFCRVPMQVKKPSINSGWNNNCFIV